MRTFKTKHCKYCNTEYTPTGSSSFYCSKEHQRLDNKDKMKIHQIRHRIWKENISKVGVGSGTGSGSSNVMYKGGLGQFRSMSLALRQEFQSCERCNKDLYNANRYEWCVHHKDHNRNNNVWSNLEMLCKRCHQLEHDCVKAFEGVTTISKESSCKCNEAPRTDQTVMI